jgi:osmotically-inducible protein OsmY
MRMATPSAQDASNKGSITPTSQSDSDSDKDAALAERIRKAIVNDNKFSTSAKNIKVLFKNGIVTLQGSVRNDQEKAEIITRTRRITGTARIDDELDILDN